MNINKPIEEMDEYDYKIEEIRVYMDNLRVKEIKQKFYEDHNDKNLNTNEKFKRKK